MAEPQVTQADRERADWIVRRWWDEAKVDKEWFKYSLALELAKARQQAHAERDEEAAAVITGFCKEIRAIAESVPKRDTKFSKAEFKKAMNRLASWVASSNAQQLLAERDKRVKEEAEEKVIRHYER